MNADISSAGVYTDFQGLERLRNASNVDSPETLRAVAQQFEALFMQMMLKNMRETNFGDGLFDNDETKFYQEMFDKQISVSMSERQGLGIAEIIVRQLSRNGGAGSLDDSKAVDGSSNVRSETAIKSPGEFINTLKPIADKVGKDIGVEPDVLLAQAALETGWGRKVTHHPDGSSSHNLFGIKADARWQGDRVSASTIEFQNGIAVKRNDVFRSYNSYEESFRDYEDFLKTNDRYEHALTQAGDPAGFISALQDAGYATDPDYAQKITGILQHPVFSTANDAIKES
jgi:flagellar protein FlgJ